MAADRTPAAEVAPLVPAAAIRALRDAIAALGRKSLPNGGNAENSNTVVHMLGATIEDVQALHEYLLASEQPPGDPQ